jgi:hypothetical protein
MRAKPESIAEWVKEFEETGRISSSWKLQDHEDTLEAIIAGNRKQTLRSVWKQLKDAKVKVSYGTVEAHLGRMGYRRNSRGELRVDRVCE